MTVLLVNTGNASRRRHFRRARELAERIVLLQRAPTWERAFVDAVVDVDTSRLDTCMEAAREIAKDEDLDAVVTFVEHSVVSAAAIADLLGLPGVSLSAATRARDKFQMRSAFRDAGLACPGFGLARSVPEARAVCSDVGFPLVLKPLIGGGSQHVYRADAWDRVEALLPELVAVSWRDYDYDPLYEQYAARYGHAVLIEAYVEGEEVSVESLAFDGRVSTIAIHDKPWPMRGPTFEELYSATPSSHPISVQERIRDVTAAAHRALGVDNCATHTELRITPDGEPVLLELAARLGGSGIYHSALASTGVDMLAAVFDIAHGRRPTLRPQDALPTGFLPVFAGADGVLESVGGVDELLARPGVLDVDVYRGPGDRVVAPPRGVQSDAHIVFTADTRDALDRLAPELAGVLSFRVRPA